MSFAHSAAEKTAEAQVVRKVKSAGKSAGKQAKAKLMDSVLPGGPVSKWDAWRRWSEDGPKGVDWQKVKQVGAEGASSAVGKSLGILPAAALTTAGVYSAHKGVQAVKGARGHKKMIQHAGDEYQDLSPQQKAEADKYYKAIKKHSPTLASDPIAAWNQVHYFVKRPTSYGPGAIEQMQKIEKGSPSVFKRN